MAEKALASWREKIYEVVFGTESPAGRTFDLLLLIAIVLSVGTVMLDSVEPLHWKYNDLFHSAEWFFTILFTFEYIARLSCVRSPAKYAKSFFGIVDLLSIIPTYLSLLLPGSEAFLVIRILRVLRIFRVLKLVFHLREGEFIMKALKASRPKITVFLFAIVTLCILLGSVMYIIESPDDGFTSIPRSIYWAVVTLTTVGYGDISPQTELGQAVAAFVMILGYGMIAVPTGIVTAEMTRAKHDDTLRLHCPVCEDRDHEARARFCKSCGEALITDQGPRRFSSPPPEKYVPKEKGGAGNT